MKLSAKLAILATLLGAMLVGELSAQQTTAFTYQGQLADAGSPATGLYDLHFEVFNAPEGGDSLGEIATTATTVANGLFTVLLDFGPGVFDGGPRWLEIGARANGEDGYDILSPRQQVTPVPFATKAGAVDASGITGTLSPAAIGPGSITTSMLANGAVGPSQLATDVGLWTRSGADIHYDGGKVGIGTATPMQELNIAMSEGGESAMALTVPHVFNDPLDSIRPPGRSTSGASGVAWVNPKAALLSDDTFATLDIVGEDVSGATLTLDDFRFRIPADATIRGIQVICESRIGSSSDLPGKMEVRVSTGSITKYLFGGATMADHPFGNATDLWGGSPKPADVNDPTFAVRLSSKSGSMFSRGEAEYHVVLDQVRVVIFYTTPRGGFRHYTVGSRPGTASLEFAPGPDLTSPVMTLTREGRLGIGTGEPAQELEIRPGGDAEAAATFAVPHTFHDPSNVVSPPTTATGAAWANPANALASDNAYASESVSGNEAGGGNLTVAGFNFAIPADATIAGLEVVIEASMINNSDGFSPGRTEVSLATESATRSFTGGSEESARTFGSPGDTWNAALNPTLVNDPGFGAQIRIVAGSIMLGGSASYSIWIDQAQIVVYYTTPRDDLMSYAVGTRQGTGDFRIARGATLESPDLTLTQGGDVGIGTTAPTATLHVVGNILATGTITPSSDRNLKKNFTTVDPGEILNQVAALPIQQWAYRSEEDTVRHVGPMAQDFHAAFHLGANDTTIATVDADGVALAAIQGLNRKLEEKETEIAGLKERILRLERLMDANRKEAAQ